MPTTGSLLVVSFWTFLATACGGSSNSTDSDDDAAGTAGSAAGTSGAGGGSSGKGGSSGRGGSTGKGGSSGDNGSTGGAGTGQVAAGAGGFAGAAAWTECPPSPSVGAECIGTFTCDYPGSCTACGCCSEASGCRDGVITYLGNSDGCLQQCPGAGGQAGFGGQAGVAGQAGVSGEAGASGEGGVSGQAGSGEGGAAGAGDPQPPDLLECSVGTACGEVVEQSGELVIPPTDASSRCTIQGLHDRTPGIYRHTTVITNGIGQPYSSMTVYVVKEDGSANSIVWSGGVRSVPQVCALQEPAYYEPCLATEPTGDYAPPECRGLVWVIDCVAGEVSCD